MSYLPILGKMIKLYKKLHEHHGPKAAWVVALILAAVYGLGVPTLVLVLMRRRKARYYWVEDPAHRGHGKYEPRTTKPTNSSAYNFLQLEQQVSEQDDISMAIIRQSATHLITEPFVYQVVNLSLYLKSMPMIRDLERREDVIYRVMASIREKDREAFEARASAEEQFALTQGQPIDDFWRPLKPHCFWWKIFLVS